MTEITLADVRKLLDSGQLQFKATQGAICLPILQRIYAKMNYGIPFDTIRVVESTINNGHHRYVCSMLSGIAIGISDWTLNPSDVTYDWGDVQIVEEDYESPQLIEKHNLRDAEISGVDIEIIRNL